MFKKGDDVVLVRDKNIKIHKVDFIHDDELISVTDGFGYDLKFPEQLKHATPEEIAAGHRIDLETLRDCDTSPNCKKFDERVKR